jgi:predicted permease
LEEVRPELRGQSIEYEQGVVSGDYFQAMGIPLLAGRSFSSSDGPESGLVVIVSADLGRILWGSLDPLGRRVNLFDNKSRKQVPATVVGVVGGIRQRGLDVQPNPALYRPLSQAEAMGQLVVVVKGQNPERFATAVRQLARELDRAVIVGNVQTFDEILRRHTAAPRFLAILLGSFAAFAVLLAAIGIYGVLSYGVSLRTQEIGIRMALGARPGAVLLMTLISGLKFAGVGLALGLVAAFWLSRFMKTLLFEVSTTDPLVYAGIAFFVGAVAVLACWIPARRAARVDPIVALRYE